MSTDTSRIVNFVNSFHEFWSLPFQVGICLFLLYQQVIKITFFKLNFLTGPVTLIIRRSHLRSPYNLKLLKFCFIQFVLLPIG